jgi:hypothetical protein
MTDNPGIKLAPHEWFEIRTPINGGYQAKTSCLKCGVTKGEEESYICPAAQKVSENGERK